MQIWSMRTSSTPSPITAPATRRRRQRFQLHRTEELLGRGGRWCRWAGVAAATGTGGRDTQPHPGTTADAGPERGEVTAYQDGVWLGRAIVPVDAIAPGEAPPEWNKARG